MKNEIESIIIVGGGSSGWMTAAAIIKNLPNIKLTLIESPNIPIIGVGESTLGHINEYMHFIGLKDEDWMKHCNATYKTSIKFTDFANNPQEKPTSFHYPFGCFDFTDKPTGIMDWFIYKAKNPDTPNSNFAEFYHDAVFMIDENKLTKNENGCIRNFIFNRDTAYHMDASLFGNYLRDHICKPNNIRHILSNVKDIKLDKEGAVTSVVTDSGEYDADLYIDCTGFKSLILDQKMKVPFMSFHDTLMNDRAIATIIDYVDKEKEMESVTNCTAIECGWVWNIPLWNRIGTGYVYSSEFATEEQALEQFKRHLKSNRMICQDDDRVEKAEYRHIKIRHGVHEQSWVKNVVGIGLSNGFIEPLESTGLMLTHEAILKMVNILKTRNCVVTKFDVDGYNFNLRQQILGFKEFISLHYALSARRDTPYWKKVSQQITYCPSMLDKETGSNQYANVSNFGISKREFNSDMGGIPYIAAGMGLNPVDDRRVDFINRLQDSNADEYFWARTRDVWELHVRDLKRILKRLPTHYKYLLDNIYNK
jgi:tryptophan halogenase